MELDHKHKVIYIENENLDIQIKVKNSKRYKNIREENNGKMKKIILEDQIRRLISDSFKDEYPFPLRKEINKFLPSD